LCLGGGSKSLAPALVKNIGYFADSDHSMLQWNICYENETGDEKASSQNFDYVKGKYEAIKQGLDLVQWEAGWHATVIN